MSCFFYCQNKEKYMKKLKLYLSVLLAMMIIVSAVPLTAFADNVSTSESNDSNTSLNISSSDLTSSEITTSESSTAEEASTGSSEVSEFVPGYTISQEEMNGTLIYPVPSSCTITQGFESGIHDGIDISAEKGSEVISAGDGTVTDIQYWDGTTLTGSQSYGNMILIKLNNDLTVRYAHLNNISVQIGQKISSCEIIGTIGMTGNATGYHLHFEVMDADGSHVDPKAYITGGNIDAGTMMSASIRLFSTASTSGKTAVHWNSLKSSFNSTAFGLLGDLPSKGMIVNGVEHPAYCINHDKLVWGDIDFSWNNLPYIEKSTVTHIMALGFSETDQLDGSGNSGEATEKWMVTQCLVWAACNGHIVRNTPNNWTWDPIVDSDMAVVAQDSYNPSVVTNYYANLKHKLLTAYSVPSFSSNHSDGSGAEAITLNWDGSKYCTTVTDTNGVLDNFNYAMDGVTFSKSGNELTISTDKTINTDTLSEQSIHLVGNADGVAEWDCPDSAIQNMVTLQYSNTDPVLSILKLRTNGPHITTTATDGEGSKVIDPLGEAEIVDEVKYSGAVPGSEYQIDGILMDKATGEAVTNDSQDVTASSSFTASSSEGVADITFRFSASDLSGHTLVVFEHMLQNGTEVASAADLNDADETISVGSPEIKTTAETGSGEKYDFTDTSFKINDSVNYTGLIPGKEYTISGRLIEAETGNILTSSGSEAPALLEQIGGEIDRYRTRIEQERGSEIYGRK
jgi:murein DD-endopeptidase MepM/ murein hydrolase activator NlpD